MTRQLFTVDVEESFHASALEPFITRSQWSDFPSRVGQGVDRLLQLMDQHGARGTFFTLGLVAERSPDVVRRIAAAGHEIASHGWSHRRVTSLSREEFRCELARSRDLLSDVTGKPVLGFRAPNFSITPACDWAFDILLEEGYHYDSSVFPSRSSGRGFASGVHRIRRAAGELVEVPMTSAAFGSLHVPAGGGAWFRLLPYGLSRRALKQAAARGEPGVFYIHPWEMDAEQPRLTLNARTRVRHYGGLGQVPQRLTRLLSEFSFVSIGQWLQSRSGLVAAQTDSVAGVMPT
jgi:polysaccharide deacetylase family protein (PEP-CTERM system associated)